ncbi:MAG: TraR/DksA C4-type zinc finger protein [Stenotrophomonas sp.]|uniref:TraR/DksA C4-type zinc finger protein n=1 Tax=Stenotrophomonas sp. TaxID=69392 RepID=UPI003D6D1F35
MAGEVDARAWEVFEQGRRAREAHRPGAPTTLTPMNCDDCGSEIPAARQRAVPSTRRCISCATARETT